MLFRMVLRAAADAGLKAARTSGRRRSPGTPAAPDWLRQAFRILRRFRP
jgi:hypothetical protein